MKAAFPIRLVINTENELVIKGNEEPFILDAAPTFPGVSGFDANGNRATNIVGFDGQDLLKKCTNPKCEKPIKPREEGFGSAGRCTNTRTGMRRDQAQCKACRSKRR